MRKRTRICYEAGCDKPVEQTPHQLRGNPYWCRKHDEERLDRISRQFTEMAQDYVRDIKQITPWMAKTKGVVD